MLFLHRYIYHIRVAKRRHDLPQLLKITVVFSSLRKTNAAKKSGNHCCLRQKRKAKRNDGDVTRTRLEVVGVGIRTLLCRLKLMRKNIILSSVCATLASIREGRRTTGAVILYLYFTRTSSVSSNKHYATSFQEHQNFLSPIFRQVSLWQPFAVFASAQSYVSSVRELSRLKY